ncbi:MAG: hypothetical protein IJ631_01315 [Schwartzia sp.]|nr:hypothetical protein [Schwartzia sp. (in: firmicutes)]
MNEPDFRCPQCHSENIQSYELIYSQNVSSSKGSSTGVGLTTNGKIGVGTANTSGTSITNLGKSVAPPAKKGLGGCGCFLWLAVIFGLLLFFMGSSGSRIVGIILAGACVWLGTEMDKRDKKWNEEEYPKLLDEWKHSYMCMKCGHRFTLR